MNPNGAHQHSPQNGAAPAQMTTRNALGGETTTLRGVTAMSSPIAAQMVAEAQARFVMAMQRPRSWADVRQSLLKTCADPDFADEAWYVKPIGDGVVGLSIRFAEAAARAMGNLYTRSYVTYEDDDQIQLRVMCEDLESNHTDARDIAVRKVVERSNSRGREVVGERTNQYNKTVYVVKATTDEIRGVINSELSRAKRNLILAMLPAEVKSECVEKLLAIRAQKDAEDPNRRLKSLVDKFGALTVTTRHLAEWIGHSVDTCTIDEIRELGDVYRSMTREDSPLTWADVMDQRETQRAEFAAAKRAREEVAREKAAAKEKAKAAGEAAREKVGQPEGATPPKKDAPKANFAVLLKAAQAIGFNMASAGTHIRQLQEAGMLNGGDMRALGDEGYANAIGLLAFDFPSGSVLPELEAKVRNALPDELKHLASSTTGQDPNDDASAGGES